MGNVIEFELKSGKTTDPARHATEIASLSLALADHLQTIDVCRRSFEKDIKTIAAIACGTPDPKVRERLLRQLELLHNGLALALLTASGAKRSMQETGRENVR